MKCNNCFEEHDDEYKVCPACGYTKGDAPVEPYLLYPGMMLQGRYIVGASIGIGGFGITYKAYDAKLERVVAIKEYYPSGVVNRTPGTTEVMVVNAKHYQQFAIGITRFLDEARNATKFINNPNIVDVMEYFEENGTAYYVMELLTGVRLDELINLNGGRLDDNAVISITKALCTALSEIHRAGYIHRDIAPDNIYICDNGKIKLFDFGAARFYENERDHSLILKVGYTPVEQYNKASKQGPWTDIYAVGATMYKMLTGEKPLESTNRKVEDTLVPPKDIVPDISDNLSKAVMRAMAIDMHLRFQTVKELEEAITSNRKVISVESVRKRRKLSRFVGVVASLMLLVCGTLLFLSDLNKQHTDATLPDATIDFWYIAETDSESGMLEMVKDFIEMYPNVTINTYSYPEDEYYSKLSEAIKNGKKPAIFESTDAGTEIMANVMNIKDVYKEIDGNECYFFNAVNYNEKDCQSVPSSFEMPVIFINTTKAQCSTETINALVAVKTDVNGKKYSLSDEWKEYYLDNVVTNGWDECDGGIDAFLEGNATVYLGSSADMEQVYAYLSGKCAHYTLQGDTVGCMVGNEWSISKLSNSEIMVAKRLLKYMLEDPTTQDYMYMQGSYGDKTKLPINKSAIETLIEDDVQFYGKILSEIEDFYMIED